MGTLNPADVDSFRDHLRELEAMLEATPRGTAGRQELMREVHEKRGIWRKAEVSIGRRAGGMSVGGNIVNLLDLQKLTVLTNGYKKAANRNTGKPISSDIAEFESRVQGTFG